MLTEEQQLRAEVHAARSAAEMIAERLWLEMEAKKRQKRDDRRFVMIGVMVVCSLFVVWFWR